jgi:hypothetical protein
MPLARATFSTADLRRRAPLALLAAGCCWIAGCGVQAYEERLNNANEMFKYQNRLDAVLARTPWPAPHGFEVSMRVPNGYVQQAAPKPPAEGEEGEDAPAPVVDPRQPTYLGIPELEGLLGAWKATVPAANNQQSFVFLYVVGNHQRMLTSSPGEQSLPADEFLKDLESLLQLQLGVTLAEGGQSGSQDNSRVRESLPPERLARFAKRKEFDSFHIVPSAGALQQLGLPELDVYLYEHRAGSIQVAVLLVTPRAVLGSPDTNLRIALETLQVSDRAPRRAAPGQSGAPTPERGF